MAAPSPPPVLASDQIPEPFGVPATMPSTNENGQSTTPTTAASDAASTPSKSIDFTPRTKEFWFIPIPKPLRYDPEKPVHFGLFLNIIFGAASTFVVANLYYNNPLLINISESFGVTYSEVSNIPTLTQAGYATGILLLSPLGDLVHRRSLLLLVIFMSGSLTIGLALTNSLHAFEALTYLVGVFSITPQILIPLSADLAPIERRATAVSIVLSGLLLGVLIARVLAGIIGEYSSWRNVYYMAIGMNFFTLFVLYFVIPDFPKKNRGTGLTYFGVLKTMGKLAVTEPVLIQGCFIGIASSAIFVNFWVPLTFLLGGPPYFYNTLQIGLFGLLGMLGVFTAPFVGKFIDMLAPWMGAFIAITMTLIFQAVQTAAGGIHVAAVIIACFGLDVGAQMLQVSVTSMVYSIDPSVRARLNAVWIISIFLGQVMGTSVGTRVWEQHGWRISAALSLAWVGWMYFMLFLRGPHASRKTWIGWDGGWSWRRTDIQPAQPPKEKEAVAESTEEKVMDAESK